VPDPLDLLDQEVDRFGRSVGDAAGVEVGQQLGAPGVDGAGQSLEFVDAGVGAVGEPGVEMLFGAGPVGAAVEQAQFLGGDPGLGQLLVGGVTGVEAGQQPGPGSLA
jgi:hypothetical protein